MAAGLPPPKVCILLCIYNIIYVLFFVSYILSVPLRLLPIYAIHIIPIQRIYAHGWWTRDGEKMSKSLGNVIDPKILVQLYGVDYIRYFLIAEIAFGGDGDFSHDTFASRINSDLANDVGNLLQRVLTFSYKQFDQKIPIPTTTLTTDDKEFLEYTEKCYNNVNECMYIQDLKGMSEAVIAIAKQGNRYMDSNAPWKLIKTDPIRCGTVLYVLAEAMRRTGVLLQPIMPKSAGLLLDQLAVPQGHARTFASLNEVCTIPGTPLTAPYPIFPKIDLTQLPQDLIKPVVIPQVNSSENNSENLKLDITTLTTVEELTSKIAVVGEEVRQLKARKASKEEVKPLVHLLLALKDRYVCVLYSYIMVLMCLYVLITIFCIYAQAEGPYYNMRLKYLVLTYAKLIGLGHHLEPSVQNIIYLICV